MILNNYHYIILDHTLTLIHQFLNVLPNCVLLYLLKQSVSGAQFLNSTFLVAVFATEAAAAVFATVILLLYKYL